MTQYDKAWTWLYLAIHEHEDLTTVFEHIFSDADFQIQYNQQDSYIWKHKEEIKICIS